MAVLLKFTNDAIDKIEAPPSDRDEYKDSKCSGLYLRVTAKGVKSFSFVGRARGSSRTERATIGKFPVVKVDEARKRAMDIAARLAAGESVREADKVLKGEMTLSDLRKLYEERTSRRKPSKKAKADARSELSWRLHIEPAFGKRRLSEISAADVAKWHDRIPGRILRERQKKADERAEKAAAKRREIDERQALRRRGPLPKERPAAAEKLSKITGERSANLALAELRAMFNWALKPMVGHFKGVNPAIGHDTYTDVERERFLRPFELAPFFEALAAEPNETMRDYFLIALLTGARRANVSAMAWEDIDLERAEWRVKGEFMKNGEPQTITLSPEAVLVLKNRMPQDAKGFVFPSKSKSGHITDPRRAWTRLLDAAEIDDLRGHDLRRTLGSWQARTGASLLVIGKSLNQKSPQATAIYARLDLDPVRQSVDRATSAMFEAANIRPGAEVVPIKSAKVAKVAAVEESRTG